MKILHVLNTNKLSGAENVAADICMMLKDNYEMAYCSPNGSIKESLEDRGVEFIPIKKMNVIELRKVVKKFKPDIIHAHDIRATVLATLVSGKIPVVTHLHVKGEDMSNISLKSLLYMFASKKAKKVIVVSKSCLDEYRFKQTIQEKSILLQNIIHSSRVEKLLEKDNNNFSFDFVFLGRLSYQKNPQKIAKVASMVLKKYPSATFGVIGEGELKNEMQAVFKAEDVIDRVTFTGKLSYPYKALKEAKCMLMCSRYEGTPIAALEAMALGTPIISTPVDGMLDLIINQETGFLASKDEELSKVVLKVLSNEDLQKEMSVASVERFRNLNQEDDYKEALISLYNTILNH
ncbi:TPA: glycosyltransferase [Bacillus cereus]|uniref:glycosyltransferase n=1 Tax=Bacillus thuringiensis TaxID=1428 RepID=UPI002FFF26C4